MPTVKTSVCFIKSKDLENYPPFPKKVYSNYAWNETFYRTTFNEKLN